MPHFNYAVDLTTVERFRRTKWVFREVCKVCATAGFHLARVVWPFPIPSISRAFTFECDQNKLPPAAHSTTCSINKPVPRSLARRALDVLLKCGIYNGASRKWNAAAGAFALHKTRCGNTAQQPCKRASERTNAHCTFSSLELFAVLFIVSKWYGLELKFNRAAPSGIDLIV